MTPWQRVESLWALVMSRHRKGLALRVLEVHSERSFAEVAPVLAGADDRRQGRGVPKGSVADFRVAAA